MKHIYDPRNDRLYLELELELKIDWSYSYNGLFLEI